MYNENNYYEDTYGRIIVVKDGVDIDYGRLRSIKTESGHEFVTDLRNYGDLVESLMGDSMEMGQFDGQANFNLSIQVGEEGELGSFRLWPVNNDDVDGLCRLLTLATGYVVKVESKARVLAVYDGYEDKEKSHGLDHFYEEVEPWLIEATTWPRTEMTYDRAVEVLTAASRDELRDHAFGDKELYWNNTYGHLVATGYSGRDAVEIGMAGFNVVFTDEQTRHLVTLGKLGKIERNDSMGDD